ncbi:lipocalin-like domain-containing protein [Nitrospira sp.]|uniref:lipocalin-like domain-containing protein n=1 Tax=Nitrospira sp. TaxID=70125 RepID=UPI003FCD1E1F
MSTRSLVREISLLFIFPLLGISAVSAETPVVELHEFTPARPGYVYAFPQDHGSHEQFQTEWWYFTGHLSTTNGRRFGYELTFFRRGIDSPDAWSNPSAWAMRHLYFAHFALTDEANEQFWFAEKLSRAGINKAGAEADRLHVWIDRWLLEAVASNHRQFHLQAQAEGFSIDLTLESSKSHVIHGTDGVSRKGKEAEAISHYYSMTRLQTTGSVVVEGVPLAVNGVSWMDHEFGSADLSDGLVGWDWFSLQLENNYDIMAYGLRRVDGTFDPASSGTLVRPDGSSTSISFEALNVRVQEHWTSPASGARYPSQWTLSIPSERVELNISPRMANQELVTRRSTAVTYWEGAVDVTGFWKGENIHGQGYVELTGYAEPYRP